MYLGRLKVTRNDHVIHLADVVIPMGNFPRISETVPTSASQIGPNVPQIGVEM